MNIRRILFRKLEFILPAVILLISFSCSNQEPAKDAEKEKSTEKSKDDVITISDELAKDPNNADLYLKRSIMFLEKNNTKQSFDDILKAVSIDSTRAEYHKQLGEVYFKTLQIQKAIESFTKAKTLSENKNETELKKDISLKLAELYLYIKVYPKSLSEANEVLKIDKYTAKAYFIKGFDFKEMGDTGKAISSFQTATEVNPEYYDAYIQLGNIQAALKNPIAVQYYNNALKIRPASTEAYYDRGLFLQNMGEIEKATEDYKTILKIDNQYSSAHYNLGYIDLAFHKDYKSAISHFTDAIRVNSEYAEAYYNRGLCYETLGDEMSAVKDYKQALTIFPGFKMAKDKLKGRK